MRIPAGEVVLHDARRDLRRTVALNTFEIAATPVTEHEFATRVLHPDASAGHGVPAHGVRWLDAIEWCNEASRVAGHEPAYERTGSRVQWRADANGYRLPTEAEWVRAASGGVEAATYGELGAIAWTAADDIEGPHMVATKQPNGYGVFDALGNVWEWCWDRIDPARYGHYRVLKGGGWADEAYSCRLGVRRGNAPDAVVDDIGFRVVRGAVAPSLSGETQGWSEAADRRRAALPPPLPVGWTPLQPDE